MAITENLQNNFEQDYLYLDIPVKAGAIHIYRDSIVNIDAAGLAVVGGDTAAQVFGGVATCELDQVAGGSDGDYSIKVIAAKSSKVVRMKLTGVVQADIYAKCFVVDNGTVALAATTTNDVEVGTIVRLDDETNYCFVLLN